VAVHAFLAGRIEFLDIPEVIEQTLEGQPAQRVHSFDALSVADQRARELAGELVSARAAA
jgi:1-deoxy-D-xylulose-5-phosphate reductoisomerase